MFRSIVISPEDANIVMCREDQQRRDNEKRQRKRQREAIDRNGEGDMEGDRSPEGDGALEEDGAPEGDSAENGQENDGDGSEGEEGEDNVDSDNNYEPRLKKTNCAGDDDDDDGDGSWVKVPRNLLHRLTPLAEKMGLSIRSHLSLTVGVYELLGLDSTEQDLSLSTTWRTRRDHAAFVANDSLQEAFRNIQETNAKLFVHFDEVEVEHDMDGLKEKKTRLVVVISSPAMAKNEQLLCAIPMEERTGAAIAESIYLTLVEHGINNRVMGIIADTTAANYGRYSGAVKLLQVHPYLYLYL